MKRVPATFAILAFVSTTLSADLTVVTTMTMEGPAAAMAAGAGMPRMTMRIKGSRGRNDVEMGQVTATSIVDLDKKQMIVLDPSTSTARVFNSGATPSSDATMAAPGMDMKLTPTGRTREIDGRPCQEHSFSMTMDMSAMTGGQQVPPEAAEMMKGVVIVANGSMWVARAGSGVDEYRAFMKATQAANMAGVFASAFPAAAGPGLDRMAAAAAKLDGLAYLVEMTMTVEGAGPMVEMMKQHMSAMKVTMKVTDVSTAAVPDETFAIPEGYKVVK